MVSEKRLGLGRTAANGQQMFLPLDDCLNLINRLSFVAGREDLTEEDRQRLNDLIENLLELCRILNCGQF